MAQVAPGLEGSRYELRRELGRGAYGVVHEAFDREYGRSVALKVLDDLSPESRRRFKREFRIVRDLHHPNVAELYELTTRDDGWYMTMELVHGQDFDVYARARPQQLSDLLLQLARGIRALHVHGVLHRDLKPSNVLVDGKSRVVVLDFGLATELEGSAAPLTSPGKVRGTPAYMSPEQAQGRAASEASDWYAFGAMAYECIAGSPPHLMHTDDPSSMGVLLAKVTRDAPELLPLAPHTPPEQIALVMELLRRDPKQRPRGADVLARLGAHSEDELDVTGARQRGQVFVGREAELAALHRAYERLEEETPSTVCVRGAFGLGKSTLLAQFEADLRKHSDTLVITGRCSPHETVPFRAFDGVIDELSTEGPLLRRAATLLSNEQAAALQRVFPVLSGRLDRPLRWGGVSVDDAEAPRGPLGRSLAFAALRLVLCELARDQRVVLCIEDVHWADPDSAAAMRALQAGDAPLPVLILMTCEVPWHDPEGFAAQLDEEIRAGHVEELALGPLSDEQSEELMVMLSERADPGTRELARRARGVPLLVRELARDVRTGRLASLLPKAASGEPALEQLVRMRLLALDTAQRDALQLLSTSATSLSARQLERLLGPSRESQKLIGALVSQGLVERTGSALKLAFEPMRDWVLSPLSAQARRALHLRVADGLSAAREPTQAAALSYHYRHGERTDLARGYASVAARSAVSQLALGQAARLYVDAIRLHGADTEAAKALHSELTDALLGGPRPDAAPVFLPACGDLVGGKYRIGDLLGRGGMGAVFSATNMRTGKHVALKWLLPLRLDPQGARARFAREAQAAGRIHHPNVVDVYDVGEHEGSSFLVMELLRGEPLSNRLERGPLSTRDVLDIMLPVLQGVAAAHECGVVHRDLKPQNIFLSDVEGSSPPLPKVLDFGISKIGETFDGSTSDTITREGVILGTPQYMAPEQLRGLSDVDTRADIYSLGVILYVMLTGELPFKGKSYNELVFQVATDTPTPPHERRAELGPELGQVVMRAMARNRDDRYASIRELEHALTHLSLAPRAPLKKLPHLGTGLLVLFLGVVVALSMLAWRSTSNDKPVQIPPSAGLLPAQSHDPLPAARTAPAPDDLSVAPGRSAEPEGSAQAASPPEAAPAASSPASPKPAAPSTRTGAEGSEGREPRQSVLQRPGGASRDPELLPPASEAPPPEPSVAPRPRDDDNRAGGISLDDF